MTYLALALSALVVLSELPAYSVDDELHEAVRLLEKLSREGVNVTAQARAVNAALQLRRANKSEDADAVLRQVIEELRAQEQQLPSYNLQKWLRIGIYLSLLLSIPPLFYYFFPRVYALAWARARRRWLARRKVVKSDSRR